MPDEHMHPNRGWTLLRDGRQFTPDEIDHVDHCHECAEWLALFADLALNFSNNFDVDTPFIVEVDQHLGPERGVVLIRDQGKLSPAEQGHLIRCHLCNTWLCGLAAIARKAGFSIAFEIRPWSCPPQ